MNFKFPLIVLLSGLIVHGALAQAAPQGTESFDSIMSRAEKGDAVAQFNVGYAYQSGEGAPQNSVTAARWYRRAADSGNLGAQFMLGFMYRTGEGVDVDYAEALKWYRKAAERGEEASMSELGGMYEHGLGVPQNYETAAEWYTKAARGGFGRANLARLYRDGHGVKQDDAEAIRLFRIAAENGEASAQSDLGVQYARGRGVGRDDVQAYKWFTVAMKSGDRDAQTNRNLVVKRMSAPQIEDAEREANEFIPKRTSKSHVPASSRP